MLVLRSDICSHHVTTYKMTMVSKVSLTVETGIVLVPYFSYWIWPSLIHKEMLNVTATWYIIFCWYSLETHPCLNRNRVGEIRCENNWENREGKFQSGCKIHNCCGTMVLHHVNICQLCLFNKLLIGQ